MSDTAIYTEMSKPERQARFWSRLAADGDCQLWTMATNPSGYGVFRIGVAGTNYTCTAHRVAWMLANGRPVPLGMEVDHTCRRRGCCEPRHLEAVSKRENIARSHGRSLATQAETVRVGKRSIHLRRQARGDRFLVTWREYLADGSTIQRGESFASREEAERAASVC